MKFTDVVIGLLVVGYITGQAGCESPKKKLDAEVVSAQKALSVGADGIVGRGTCKAFNTLPAAKRTALMADPNLKGGMKKIAANCEQRKASVDKSIVLAQKELGVTADGAVGRGTCKAFDSYSDEKLNAVFKGKNESLKGGMSKIFSRCADIKDAAYASEKKSKWITCRVAIKKALGNVSIRKNSIGAPGNYDGNTYSTVVEVRGKNAFGMKVSNAVSCDISGGMISIDNGFEKFQFSE